MKKILLGIVMLIFLSLGTVNSYAEENTSSSEEASNVIDSYIDNQLEKIKLKEIEEEIKDGLILDGSDLRGFLADLISGEKNILDIFNQENIKKVIYTEFVASLRVMATIIAIAFLSSILNSLQSSFSSDAVSKAVKMVLFMVLATFITIGFKDVIDICNSTVSTIINVMQYMIPIIITFLVAIGLPITSTMIQPIFLGATIFINLFMKNFLTLSMIFAFALTVANYMAKASSSKSTLDLKKGINFIKQINSICIGGMFTIYLAVLSIQGLYVTNFDKFGVKTVKYALGNFIPIVGGFVSDSVDMLISSSQLIKNVFGVLGLVIIIGVCILPVIKIAFIVFAYKVSSVLVGVVELGSDSTISDFIEDTTKFMTILLVSLLAVCIMFFLTIAALTAINVAR